MMEANVPPMGESGDASSAKGIMDKPLNVDFRNVKLNCSSADAVSSNLPILLLLRCANFAAVKHTQQRRKDQQQTPYINHPLGVAMIIAEEGGVTDVNVLMAAILHDTVEDTETTFEEIEENFGPVVRRIVGEVTDDKTLTWQQRKCNQVINARRVSYEAKLVKLADKLYNLRDINRVYPVGWTEARVQRYFDWAYQVFLGLKGTNSGLERKLEEVFEVRRRYAADKKLSDLSDAADGFPDYDLPMQAEINPDLPLGTSVPGAASRPEEALSSTAPDNFERRT